MGARLVHQLSDCGLTVRAEGNALIVEPRNLITDPLRQFIREHKAEIVAELQSVISVSSVPVRQSDKSVRTESEAALCLACQHYRFGHDHAGNVARCHAAGGFRGVLIERPEQRRECGDFIIYQGGA